VSIDPHIPHPTSQALDISNAFSFSFFIFFNFFNNLNSFGLSQEPPRPPTPPPPIPSVRDSLGRTHALWCALFQPPPSSITSGRGAGADQCGGSLGRMLVFSILMLRMTVSPILMLDSRFS
jgi:hypothetical protein